MLQPHFVLPTVPEPMSLLAAGAVPGTPAWLLRAAPLRFSSAIVRVIVFLSIFCTHDAAVSCPANSTGASVPAGCTCLAGLSGAVTPSTSFPFYTMTCSGAPALFVARCLTII
jgi:hypothetical protein